MLPMDLMPAPPARHAPARAPLAALLLLAAAGLAGCAGDATGSAGTSGESGPLAVEAPLADFGSVFEGRVLAHEWTVEVRTPVTITSAKTDCGCTLAELERA